MMKIVILNHYRHTHTHHLHHVPSHFPFVCIRSISKGLMPNVSTRRRASFSCTPPTSPSLARSGGQSSRHQITLKGAFLPQRWRRRCGWCWSLCQPSVFLHIALGGAAVAFFLCDCNFFCAPSLPGLTGENALYLCWAKREKKNKIEKASLFISSFHFCRN